jgi:phenylalanyl-tRNA synthetase beta chain
MHPTVAAMFGVDETRAVVAEIDLTACLEIVGAMTGRREVKVPRYLPAEQDFAIVVDKQVPAEEVRQALSLGAGPLATNIVLFDIFEGEQIGAGKKSLAFRVTFTAPDRTLTDADLVKSRGKLEKTIKQRVGGMLRA